MENNVIETRLKIGSPNEYLLLVNGLIINVNSIDYIKLIDVYKKEDYKISIIKKDGEILNIPIKTNDLEFCKQIITEIYDKITIKK